LNFTLMPLKDPDKQTVRDIRELMSNFISAPEHASYFATLREFHSAKTQRQKVDQSLYSFKKSPLMEIEECKNFLLNGKSKEFRARLNRIQRTESVDWKTVRILSDRIAKAKYLIKQIQDFTNGTLPKNKQGKLSESILKKKVEDFLQTPSEFLKDKTLEGCTVELEGFILHETDNILFLAFRNEFKGIDLAGQKIDIVGPKRQMHELQTTDKRLKSLEERLLSDLASQMRPSFSPFLEDYYKQRNKQIFSYKLQNAATTVTNKIPTLLDVISKGLELMNK